MRAAVPALLFAFTLQSSPSRPAVDPTVPTNGEVVRAVEGSGVQVYRCDTAGWTLVGPEAKLTDSGTHEELGTHSAGPTWTWKDGSSVTGTVKEKLASPDAGSVPWLLLAAAPAAGRPGVLAGVAMVRRSDTRGGAAPASGCDAGHAGAMVRVPYAATYTFYAAR